MVDAELLWLWANDLETRQSAFNKSPISYADHIEWLKRKLASDATRTWIFLDHGVPIGQVRFDIVGDVAEIDISVAPGHRGRGYGRAMLMDAVALLRAERGERIRLRALVLERNARSLRLFKACGFAEVDCVERAGERTVVLEPHARPANVTEE